MKMPDTRLTLIAPRPLEASLTALLLEHPQWVSGFATHEIEARGAGVALTGSAEQVAARSPRVEFDLVLERDDARSLLAVMRDRLPRRDVVYWLSPMLEFGSCQ